MGRLLSRTETEWGFRLGRRRMGMGRLFSRTETEWGFRLGRRGVGMGMLFSRTEWGLRWGSGFAVDVFAMNVLAMTSFAVAALATLAVLAKHFLLFPPEFFNLVCGVDLIDALFRVLAVLKPKAYEGRWVVDVLVVL